MNMLLMATTATDVKEEEKRKQERERNFLVWSSNKYCIGLEYKRFG